MNPQTKQRLANAILAIILAGGSFLVFSGIATDWVKETVDIAEREGLIQSPPW